MAFNGIDWFQLAAPIVAESWIASLWQGIALTAFVWASLKLFPRISASTRFVIWSLSFLVVAALPLLRYAAAAAPSQTEVANQPVARHFALQLDSRWAMAIAGVWIVTACFQLIRLGFDLRKLRVLRNNTEELASSELGTELQTLLEASGRRVRIRLSDSLDTPCALGFFRPAVILPRWLWAELSPEQVKQVVLHELAHLRRYDDWTNLLQKAVRSVCPLNPALYWIEKHLCFEREMACDDAVLNAEVAPREYATCLTTLAGRRLAQRNTVLAPGAVARQSELSRRVYGLLNRTRNYSLLVARGVAAAFLVPVVGGAFAFTQCPQWVSFASPAILPLPSTLQMAKAPSAGFEPVSLPALSVGPGRSNEHSRHSAPVARGAEPMSADVAVASEPQAVRMIPASSEQEQRIVVVFSVWESSSNVQVQRTDLVVTGERSNTTRPVATQWHQDWIFFQI